MMILYFLLILVAILAIANGVLAYKDKKTMPQLEARLQELKYKRLLELDKDIADWLAMLELPQLAEETKRLEVALQLSTVLIGKLLRSRVPCCNPNMK